MKSIMEEATSVTKAIENAWDRAGKPQEFTIKILEHPKTSFFGLKVSKSAKIALLFNEQTVKTRDTRHTASNQPHRSEQADNRQQSPRRPHHPQQMREPRDPRRAQEPRQSPTPRPEHPHRPAHEQHKERAPLERARPDKVMLRPTGPRPERTERTYESWAPEMADIAHEWVKETLVMMGKSDITITPHISQNYLKLTLSQHIMPDAKQEETQLKSWGSLAMEAVREKTNKPLRSLRIILESKR
jgi:predicted RNA-binding protein Jag